MNTNIFIEKPNKSNNYHNLNLIANWSFILYYTLDKEKEIPDSPSRGECVIIGISNKCSNR